MDMVLDHLIVSAADLTAGTASVASALGQPLQPGGQHALFGTHNQLLSLGAEDYLEVIAVDPGAAPLERARWYDLDRFGGPTRLTNWALRVSDLDAALAALGPGFGAPIAVSRGDLRWRMAVPATGVLPYDNCAPALLEWETPPPGPRLTERGCRLVELTVCHPAAEALSALLAPHFTDARVRFAAGMPRLIARVATPAGERVLA
ncbi:MAG: VOC family protein [Pseudomonadota bacterium]